MYFYIKNKRHSIAGMSLLRYNRYVNQCVWVLGEQTDEKKDIYALWYMA